MNAIDAGDDLSLSFTDDIDGELRVIWDIGADELYPPTNYRAIGTAPNYTTPGTINATAGSTVVTGTGTSWQTENRGRGDRIDINGTDYTILSVDSNTQLTLTTPVSGNFTGTHKISRQFTTLQGWETCISGAGGCVYSPVVGGDLVTDNRSEVGIADDDGAAFAMFDILGSTTDANHTITLTADGGNRHYGVAGNGVVIDGGGNTNSCSEIQDDQVTIQWIEFRNCCDSADAVERLLATLSLR